MLAQLSAIAGRAAATETGETENVVTARFIDSAIYDNALIRTTNHQELWTKGFVTTNSA